MGKSMKRTPLNAARNNNSENDYEWVSEELHIKADGNQLAANYFHILHPTMEFKEILIRKLFNGNLYIFRN